MGHPNAPPQALRGSKIGSSHHEPQGGVVPVTRTPVVRAKAQQDRSQATFEAIRAAAGELFDEVGIDGTTMDAIARRAGVSIGAVYRFFENREAIVNDIATRWRALIQEVALPQFSEQSLARGPADVIGDFLTSFRRVLDELPGARGILSAAVAHATLQDTALWTSHLERFIQRYAPGLRPARRRQAAQAYQTVTIALMTRAAEAGAGIAPQLSEARTVLLGYTHQLAAEAASGDERIIGKNRRR